MGTWDIIFLSCIGLGFLFAIVLLFVDHSHALTGGVESPVLQPVCVVSAITAFGACGFLLHRFTLLSITSVVLLSAGSGLLLAAAGYFIWIRPMKNAENSTGYSISQLEGQIGEVITTIPASGYGEIIITMLSGTSNQIASSQDQVIIPQGSRVIVVKVEDHVLQVIPFE
ncbi:NfeD family protein [Brevibacillus laterosporus]|uniref:Serine protease n=1 Tax=Brevibacillus laterosporus TaxID=1465 RepID=A0AAP8U598_BRELA|nr:NfeD family protein [Brevibacillus laterosporus]MCG7319513.1 NfeD family protein [Brevibacillus laterosporus]MED1662944.1 NfeD family protein [Brevibacillus laterosporus]MED1668431.1 NfeD family protein [Brevibacillus laterosporus]MED1717351.1 NfeD family protein [Brevibacillus laterosporus]PPA89328.1 serine protease [Brevibacillus laterosporus]